MRRMATALALAGAAPAWAAGLGEDAPFAFRTPAERQILLMGEQTRLQFRIFEEGAGGQPDGPIVNYTFLSVTGNNNTVTITQDGSGTSLDRILNRRASGAGAPSILNGTTP